MRKRDITEIDSDWQEFFSASKHKKYWYNSSTGESSWESPTNKTWIKSWSKTHDREYWTNQSSGEQVWEDPSVQPSSSTQLSNNELLSQFKTMLDEEVSLNAVDDPSFPTQMSVANIPFLMNKLRTQKPKIIEGTGKDINVKAIFILSGEDTSIITRSIQEIQMLKTRLKLRRGDKVVDLASFWEVWFQSDGKLRSEVISSADPNEAKWACQKKYNYKLATNFIPGYAKAIYEYFHAKSVLDPCAGWGDRLVGAAATETLDRYVAFDPNTRLRPGYVEIMKLFGHDLADMNNKKLVFRNNFKILTEPFEVGALSLESNSFDLVFTSPPFFEYEMYNPQNPQYKNWIDEFYIPLMHHSCRCVRPGGHVAIYVGDTSAGEIDAFMRDRVVQITSLVLRPLIGFYGLSSEKVRGIWVYQKPVQQPGTERPPNGQDS